MPVTTEAELRAIYGEPSQKVHDKQIARLDRHCRRFIELSPFFLVASSDGTRLDVSPKGDAPGSVRLEGERALLIPDWPGNRRLDGLRNLLRHSYAAVIFLIPNVSETLRVNGPATIHAEPEMLAPFETAAGKRPLTVLRVEAEEVFLHCAKAFLRSQLWQPDTWPERSALPSAGEMMRDHTGMPSDAPVESDEAMLAGFRKELY